MEKSDWSSAIPELLEWYDREGRDLPWRRDSTPYRVLVSEVMLQQTRVETVKPYFERFLAEFPDFESLAAADDQRLLKLWQGLGYYSRAMNLRRAAGQVTRDHDGVLPGDYDTIRSLCGVGGYTAGAVAAFAFGIPVPAVDGNVIRVLSRLYADSDNPATAAARKRYTEWLTPVIPADRPGDFGQALIELGALICTPKRPDCGRCPISGFCAAKRAGNPGDYPPPKPKKARKTVKMTVLQILDGDRLCIRRRPASGLLARMWELPHLEGYPDEREILLALRDFGLDPVRIERLPDAVHAFTHLTWQMRGYAVRVAPASPDPESGLRFFSLKEIGSDYAIPSAFSYFLPPG